MSEEGFVSCSFKCDETIETFERKKNRYGLVEMKAITSASRHTSKATSKKTDVHKKQ